MEIPKRKFKCLGCGHKFEEPFGKPRWMLSCPKCKSENIVRVDGAGFGGWGGGWRRGAGRGWRCRFGFGGFGFGGGRGRGRSWGWGWGR
ncbi:hypothetical protein CLV27_1475 [Phorcysia thermohydrogeniphila]|uniref:Uncharacterized protein n=1 Tax=Phorcysia thermohydrogeniphila TaxID=936138 RepID=A0A4R1G611_9BACT|nr:hypothetical protein CLV27_1475 [Phorcysia thermohydrogeniphila]